MTIVKVEALGKSGDGVVRLGDEIITIPKVLAGEEIEVNNGKLLRVLVPSPDRVPAFCVHHDTCGGCKFQHWSQKAYAPWKRQRVIDALHAHRIETPVAELIDAHGQGRRRVVLHVREIDGNWQAGFMQPRTHNLIALSSCPVLVKPLQHAPEVAAAFGPILGACDVAVTSADNGLDVSIKAERSAVARRLAALQEISTAFRLARLAVNGEALFSGNKPTVLIGKATVNLPVNTFQQATQAGEDMLAACVVKAHRKSRYVADLFCGIGPFALRLAETARVHAVDSDSAAVRSLSEAANRTQNLKPVATEVRDLFRNPLMPQELKEFDGIVLDPPRAGAEAQSRNIAKSKVKRVTAVSCDAETFARDARILLDGGYKLQSVTPIDQFKWTPHVEIVGVFER